MHKYFLYTFLISLFISSCANQRNSSDYWNKKKNMTVCDCVDMAKDLFTEVIDDYDKNPALSIDSIMKGKEADWKPLWKRCEEETNFGLSIEEEAEQCQSFKEFRILMDSITRLAINWETPQNNSSSELCDCLSEAQSEEEAQACAPDKSMDDLEAIYNDCLNDMADMEMEDMMEEALEEEDEPEDKSICECLKMSIANPDLKEPPKGSGCEWVMKISNEEGEKLMKQVMVDCPEMFNHQDSKEKETLEEEDEYIDDILTLEEELEALNEERRELIIHIRAYELDISEIEYELKSYDTIPNFDEELCRCYIDEGYMAPEIPCDYPEMSENEWDKFGTDCDDFDFLKQEISWMNDCLDEDLHYLDVLDMDIEELEAEIRMEEEIDELLEAEHNPEGSDYDFNPDLAFQAQEIFSTLESEDFDLFLNLVKVDTVDFFYWRIPSADFNLNGLTNLSMEVEGGDDMMTVNALDYLNMFKGFDMNFIIQNQGDGRFPAAGIAGSCGLKDGITDCYEKCYKIMVFKQCAHEALLENYESIEKLIAGDPYILWDALISTCVHDSEIWMVFDESNEYKLIGIYDWYWTP